MGPGLGNVLGRHRLGLQMDSIASNLLIAEENLTALSFGSDEGGLLEIFAADLADKSIVMNQPGLFYFACVHVLSLEEREEVKLALAIVHNNRDALLVLNLFELVAFHMCCEGPIEVDTNPAANRQPVVRDAYDLLVLEKEVATATFGRVLIDVGNHRVDVVGAAGISEALLGTCWDRFAEHV